VKDFLIQFRESLHGLDLVVKDDGEFAETLAAGAGWRCVQAVLREARNDGIHVRVNNLVAL
jgi:hypothetical protein